MKYLVFILFISLIFSCNTKNITIENKICEKFKQENIATSFSLFISEGMCSECINTEFQNIKENSEIMNSLIIVGVFSNKRHFNACVNSIDSENLPIKKVLINNLELNGIPLNFSPFYFIYHSDSNSVSDKFHPTICDRVSTIKYFHFVKNKYF
jgi:hypothetical protein